MEINYAGTSALLDPFSLANRHFQAAFASSSKQTVQALWDQGAIRYVDTSSPNSLLGRVKHFAFAVMEYIPFVGIVVAFADRIFNGYVSLPPSLSNKAKTAVETTPNFDSYCFSGDPSVRLTDILKRPANLFFKALFGKDPTTQPGSNVLFAFIPNAKWARNFIFGHWRDKTFSVSAKGEDTVLFRNRTPVGKKDLEKYLGKDTFNISLDEVQAMLKSQRICVSPLISKEFYLGMKRALKSDGIIILPANDHKVPTIGEILYGKYDAPSAWEKVFGVQPHLKNRNLHHLQAYLREVKKDPASHGFEGRLKFIEIESLTLYQVAAMIVKTEDYYSLVGDGYKLAKREVGDRDAIRLISASGIRGFFNTAKLPGNNNHQMDQRIMKNTFETALLAAGQGGYAVFPAVGMGVWGGDPEVYWTAFLDAVVSGASDLDAIFVNPGHQKSPAGAYKGYGGEEFALILEEYLQKHPQSKNLRKIVNLYDRKTDLLLLARNLKKACPEKTISLFNASDPDVTLGSHVGEYVNNIGHPPTTEENFAAAGTSGLGFEDITQVLSDSTRITQY
ncbi:MAG: hypothetical protein P0S96_00875 [Simkaniaceae bacterium]|nr:hypothetical protein [Candidatus Sacchlamyda saccharinae]